MTDRFCLIGTPIEHSPSPAMHNAGFAALERDARYTLRPCSPEQVGEVWSDLRTGTVRGCNVTTPLKGHAADSFVGSKRVARSRSANTVYRDEGGLRAESTDVDGVRSPLARLGINGGEALLLGAGGAARAAMLALEELGASVHVAARDAGRAGLALEQVAPRPRGRALALGELARDRALMRDLRVIVQATPVGRDGHALPIPWELLPPDCVAFEMLYVETPFTAAARARQLDVVEGWEMLLEQGLRSFELWTGVTAPREAMESALKQALSIA